MGDQFPENIDIDVDRDALRKYLRTRWFLSWLAFPVCLLGFIGFTVGTGVARETKWGETPGPVLTVMIGLGTGLLLAIVIATVLYLLFSHWLAGRLAASLRLTVEGAFVRIVCESYTRVDRKLHFRAIVDYATVEGPLMRRFGVKALQMTTTGGGILVWGIRDCERVRDTLAEIDSVREQR